MFDARGHFNEPHTGKIVPLGTLDVRGYLADVEGTKTKDDDAEDEEDDGNFEFKTIGPKNRYSAVVFIEKEGFMPLFDAAELAERYDIAIMSTKGMSVTASRQLTIQSCIE